MECHHSEQIKSLPDESGETSKGNDEHNSTSQVDKQDENSKERTEEENLSSSDKPGGEVRIYQTEDTTKDNHENKADEQIKEIIQGNQESQEDGGSKDFPCTTEDSGVSLGQGMDDCLQLVSLVCYIQKGMIRRLN